MKCPYCEKEVELPAYTWRNVETYGNAARVATPCCGKPILLTRSVCVHALAIPHNTQTIDDWGSPFEPADVSEVRNPYPFRVS